MLQLFKSTVKFLVDLPFKKIPIYYIPLGLGLYYAPRETVLIATSTWLYTQLENETERREKKALEKKQSSNSLSEIDDSSSENDSNIKYMNSVVQTKVETQEKSTNKSIQTLDKSVETSFDDSSVNSDDNSYLSNNESSIPTSKNISLSSNDASEELSITSSESKEFEDDVSIGEESLDQIMNQIIDEELTKQNNNLSWGEWIFGSKEKTH